MDDWEPEFCSPMAECNDGTRCPVDEGDGQCPLRKGHPGPHDSLGVSHLQVAHGTTWE